jgi:hypothetical protein
MLDNVQSYGALSGAYYQSQASVFAPYTNSNDWKVQPRGAWRVKSITGNSNGDGVYARGQNVENLLRSFCTKIHKRKRKYASK